MTSFERPHSPGTSNADSVTVFYSNPGGNHDYRVDRTWRFPVMPCWTSGAIDYCPLKGVV